MNKTITRILSAILLLCMIPATVITAFARGKGVYGDGRDNQSVIGAEGQFIPETIVVDGKLSDTGWDRQLWNEVDSTTGHWTTRTLYGTNGDASYRYQIRADIEQLYVGATFVMPSGVTSGRFRIWFKEDGHTDKSGALTNGYSDFITISFDLNAETKMSAFVHDPYNKGDKLSTVESGALAAQAYLLKYVLSKTDSGRDVIDFEFRNLLSDIFDSSISNVTYYVSLELPTDRKDDNGDVVYDQLFHPIYGHTENANVPTFDYWPTDADGNPGGIHIDTTLTADNNLDYEIDVDGKFDEAIWSSLVDENGSYESLLGDTVNGTGVRHNLGSYTNTKPELGYIENYNSNDADGNRKDIRFKYELRVDGTYLYGAVVAYVPPINTHTETVTFENGTTKDHTVSLSPDLSITFFDDKRCDYPVGFAPDKDDAGEATVNLNTDGTYLPEATLQIRSMFSDYGPERNALFRTFANVWPMNYAGSGYNVPAAMGWGSALVDTGDASQFSATRSRKEGNIWSFEFKVLLSAVPRDEKGNIVYSVLVSDRYAVESSKVLRTSAFSAELVGEENFDNTRPHNNYNKNKNNIISKAQIDGAASLDVASRYVFDDGTLDQDLWTALSAADDYVDGREKSTTESKATSFAHKLTADYEYLYGAVLLQGESAWDANDLLRLWLNRKKIYPELEAANSDALTIKSYKALNGVKYGSNGEVHDDGLRLNDGIFAHTEGKQTSGPLNPVFSAYVDVDPLQMQFELEELFSVDKIQIGMSGGSVNDGIPGKWGICIPQTVNVSYSVDGETWTNAKSEYTYELKYKDGYPETITNTDTGVTTEYFLDAYLITLTLDEHVSARYIKLDFVSSGFNGYWLSEVDIFGTETHGMYYAATMCLDGSRRTMSLNGIYLDGLADSNDPTANVDVNQFDYAVVDIDGTTKAVEFRISLELLGIDYNLAAKSGDELFFYYISADRRENQANVSSLVYPRNNTGRHPDRTGDNWLMDEVYDGSTMFSYGDMLGDIVIDGKLEEKYWLDESVEMIHVDAESGTWENQPTKGNTLEYDYVIYAGTNYLYGAAIIDESALASQKAYAWEGVAHTRFNIWIDNLIDEREWIEGNNYTDAIVDTGRTGTTDTIATPDNAFDGIEENGMNGDREYSVQYYFNYYYNIYLVNEETPVAAASGEQFVCGGSAPDKYSDSTKTTDGSIVDINIANWRWGMSTANGKTYVEFMIDLDNFYCDRSKGFNYYVSATHSFDNDTDDTSDDEILSLYSPKITDEVGMTQPVWITHINNMYPEGGGVIFTDKYLEAYYGDENKYWKDGATAWWLFVLFAPVAGETDTYEIKEIRNGYSNSANGIPFKKDDVASGEFVYGINHGNDWIYYKANPDKAASGTDVTTKAAVNYTSVNGEMCAAWAQSWTVGDVLKFNFSSEVSATLAGDKTTVTFDTDSLASQTGYNYKSASADGTVPANTTLKWYEPAFLIKNSATIVKKSDTRTDNEQKEYYMKAPSIGTWDSGVAGSIKPLTHFAPEVITVDGEIKEPAWADDQWITVIENANGKLRGESKIDGSGNELSELCRYQLRTDGTYLYVGAIFENVTYDWHMPSFTLWLKTDSESTTWDYQYSIAHANGTNGIVALTESDLALDYPVADGKELAIVGPVGEVDATDDYVKYKNLLNFIKNKSKTPAGANPDAANGNYEYLCSYADSEFFGHTEQIQENFAGMGEYYPVIKTTKLKLGEECATMAAKTTNVSSGTAVEFKVALSEFGGENGFEYFVEASYSDYDVFYPLVYSEPASKDERYQTNMPIWNWDDRTSAKVTADDIKSGAMKLRNHCMPVVTLGAKINPSYIDSNGDNQGQAIRMGALYTEDYLRNWRATDETELKPGDANYNEMYTAPMNDYWDVADVGIVMLPTVMLGDDELTLETPDALALSANDIVGWINAAPDGWSNFADYENFVFYATLYGVPTNVKLSFRGYVDFYASTDTESYYDHTIIRSYEMIESITNGDDWIKDHAK